MYNIHGRCVNVFTLDCEKVFTSQKIFHICKSCVALGFKTLENNLNLSLLKQGNKEVLLVLCNYVSSVTSVSFYLLSVTVII